MHTLNSKNFLSGEELPLGDLAQLIEDSDRLRNERSKGILRTDLHGKTLALLFEKPSLRTRVSFTVAMQELGGMVVECNSFTRKQEEPEDVAGVLSGYCHGVMLRTHEHGLVERMAAKSKVPVINGLSDAHHPCQGLADLLTLKQSFGSLKGLQLSYVGDGNNVLHSLMLLAPALGIHLRYACPKGYEPSREILNRAEIRSQEAGGSISGSNDPVEAVRGANAIYTDVWTSMGFEKEEASREAAFAGYQVNSALYAHASRGAVVMHCMPMVRGKEISSEMADHPSAVLFQQSENRLHVQKALLLRLMRK